MVVGGYGSGGYGGNDDFEFSIMDATTSELFLIRR